jgi:dTMP kinase
MFVVFEGIDGGGKTTLSNLVATRLRGAGLRVAHVREGGQFASSVTQAMRELGRDTRNLAMTPRAELMLYLTREVQLIDEATRPALATHDVVIADRFVYTAEALAVYGRGLPETEVAPLARAAAGDVVPDLVVLVDVDPAIARARRRVAKIVTRDAKPPSRKGLAGTALQRQLRVGYRELAAREPERWLVIDNSEADLDALATALVERIRAGAANGPRASGLGPRPEGTQSRKVLAASDLTSARTALLAWIDRRAEREPGLAAYFLDGLCGPDFDERRRMLAMKAPLVIATGLRWMTDAVSWELRRELAAAAPEEVARSIAGEAAAHPDASAMLQRMIELAPRGVAEALAWRTDAAAWELRAQLPPACAALSMRGVADPRAQALRDAWLAEQGLAQLDIATATLACQTVSGVPGDEAWALRKALRGVAPVAALDSIEGLTDERAWRWRSRWIEHAPKIVMKTIFGSDDPRAWELRFRVARTCEEVLDSIVGLDAHAAWSLRDAALARWPSSAIKSLGPLATTDRGTALIATALARCPEDVAVWRQALLRHDSGPPRA